MMLLEERIRTNRRVARRRLLREGGRLRSPLLIDGGRVEAVATERVYGATQAEIEELVNGGSTALHFHTGSRGRQNTYSFSFGGDVGQLYSYGSAVDFAFHMAVPYSSAVVRITMAVGEVAVGGSTVIQVFRDGMAVDGCQLVLPEGVQEACIQFSSALHVFGYCDRLAVGAWTTVPGMIPAKDGEVVLVLQGL